MTSHSPFLVRRRNSLPRALGRVALIMMLMLAVVLTPRSVAQAAGAVPVLGGLGGPVTFTTGGAAVTIAPGATITDDDNEVIAGARVLISANMQTGDVLAVAGCTGAIAATYSAGTGVLSLNGNDTVANYQACLRLVTFNNPANPNNTTARTVTFSLGDSLPSNCNGHWFKFVTSGLSWTDSKTAAAAASAYFGRAGYLATITSACENAFATDKLGGSTAWLGGTDSTTETDWKWNTGPEADTTFCNGNNPCVAAGGAYTNWNAGEPNDYGVGVGTENYLQFIAGGTGKWNDLAGTAGLVAGYVVEYGGTGGDSTAVISGDVTVNVTNSATTTTTTCTPSSSFTGSTTVSNANAYYLNCFYGHVYVDNGEGRATGGNHYQGSVTITSTGTMVCIQVPAGYTATTLTCVTDSGGGRKDFGIRANAQAQSPSSATAGRQSLGSAGGTFSTHPWTVIVPAGLVADTGAFEWGPFDPLAAPPLGLIWANGTIHYPISVNIYNPQGQSVTSFSPPLTVCYDYDPEELLLAGGDPNNFVILTAHIGDTTWSELTTTVNAATHQACANVDHLSLFDLAVRKPTSLPVTGVNLTPFIISAALMFALAIVGAGVLVRRRKIESLKH